MGNVLPGTKSGKPHPGRVVTSYQFLPFRGPAAVPTGSPRPSTDADTAPAVGSRGAPGTPDRTNNTDSEP